MNKGLKILVIEDNLDHQTLFKSQLKTLNLDCICIDSGCKGLYLARTYEPHLILLDIMLPDISGLTVINKLKQNPLTAKIPTIVVSANAFVEQQEQIMAAGADDYLAKPYLLDELERTIQYQVEKYHSGETKERQRVGGGRKKEEIQFLPSAFIDTSP